MRVFITGASGFIGRRLLKQLDSKKAQFLLLAKDKEENAILKRFGFPVCAGNLNNLGLFKKRVIDFAPQVCVHLAWEGIPDYSFLMSKRNLDNSISLINFLADETDCNKLIITGSCMEYGKTKGICKESDAFAINSFFSWAKCSLYTYADFVCKDFEIDLIWMRLFYVYGPGQRRGSLIPSIAHALKAGHMPAIKNPYNANDFIHVDDVVSGLRIAVTKKVKPGIYNLGSGISTKAADVFKIAQEIMNYKEKIMLSRNRTSKPINFWADISRARKLLDWEPKISLREGITDYLKKEKAI